MSFPSTSHFDISFIERTRANLEKYKGDYDFTMLINSLLGLLIIPNECIIKGEKQFKYDFLNKNLTEFNALKRVFNSDKFDFIDGGVVKQEQRFYWISNNSGCERAAKEVKLGEFIRRMRNGFAHFGYTPLKTEGSWSGIIISNKPKNKEVNFRVYLQQSELAETVKLIADLYVKNLKK